MRTVAQQFDGFAAALRLDNASAGQRKDMKLAFYGGAAAMLHSMTNAAHESGDSDDIGVTKVEQLRAELAKFAANLPRGAR